MSLPITRHPSLRVCHIISGDLWAGAEAMAFNLLRRLSCYPDLELSIILLNRGQLSQQLEELDLPVMIVDERRLSFAGILRSVRQLLQQAPPHIIHSHRYKENILAALARGRSSGIRLVATQHGLPEGGRTRSITSRFISRLNFHLLAGQFTRTVAVSADVAGHLVGNHGFLPERVRVIHNGIELPEPGKIRKGPGAFVIGSSGRLCQVKDYPLMCHIARVMGQGRVPVRFRLAGEGPERPRLEGLVQQHGLGSSFRLLGHQHDMDGFYGGLDLYLNTSLHEGIPMTILEAMARGLPVVAPAVGGIGEIVRDGVEGFLVKGRDPAEFAARCQALRDDRELYATMSQAARLRAETVFSAEAMAEAYYRLYRETV